MIPLSAFDPNKPIVMDLETVSGDKDRGGLDPYKGDKIGLIMIGQENVGIEGYLIRSGYSSKMCLPYDEFIPEFTDFVSNMRIWVNHNIKFDARFTLCEGITVPRTCELHDTMVLARLVRNDMGSYSLQNCCEAFGVVNKKRSDFIKTWLSEHKTKDYGDVDPTVLLEYGKGDIASTMELYSKLLAALPAETVPVWELEKELTYNLLMSEHNGMKLDVKFLLRKRIELLQELVITKASIDSTCGYPINPDSSIQINEFMQAQGVKPVLYTEKGSPSWGTDALEQVCIGNSVSATVAKQIIKYHELSIQDSTFCAGWMDRADKNNVIHPNFNQSGTKTGRLSSNNPNVQNPPKWIMSAITIPAGYVGIKWDMAQIEYRIFTHYSKDEALIASYLENPRIDYHQKIADRLGIPRHPVKRINFGMLYGMGKAKTKRTITVEVIENDSNDMREKLYKYVEGKVSKDEWVTNKPYSDKLFDHMSEAILEEYHMLVPAVKRMQREVKNVVFARGYIKNFFGMRAYFTPDKSYIALNSLIQGSAAFYFKAKINEIMRVAPAGTILVNNIHDAMLAITPVEHAEEYWSICKEAFKTSPFRVPILIDGEVAFNNWGNIHSIDHHKDNVCLSKRIMDLYQPQA